MNLHCEGRAIDLSSCIEDQWAKAKSGESGHYWILNLNVIEGLRSTLGHCNAHKKVIGAFIFRKFEFLNQCSMLCIYYLCLGLQKTLFFSVAHLALGKKTKKKQFPILLLNVLENSNTYVYFNSNRLAPLLDE